MTKDEAVDVLFMFARCKLYRLCGNCRAEGYGASYCQNALERQVRIAVECLENLNETEETKEESEDLLGTEEELKDFIDEGLRKNHAINNIYIRDININISKAEEAQND